MGVLVPVIVLTAWEAAVWLGLLSARYFPPPTTIAATFAHLIAGGVLWKEALVTLARLAAAFLLAAGPAVALGGTPAGNAAAAADSWPRVVQFLRTGLTAS